jgi:hypothetical protein
MPATGMMYRGVKGKTFNTTSRTNVTAVPTRIEAPATNFPLGTCLARCPAVYPATETCQGIQQQCQELEIIVFFKKKKSETSLIEVLQKRNQLPNSFNSNLERESQKLQTDRRNFLDKIFLTRKFQDASSQVNLSTVKWRFNIKKYIKNQKWKGRKLTRSSLFLLLFLVKPGSEVRIQTILGMARTVS